MTTPLTKKPTITAIRAATDARRTLLLACRFLEERYVGRRRLSHEALPWPICPPSTQGTLAPSGAGMTSSPVSLASCYEHQDRAQPDVQTPSGAGLTLAVPSRYAGSPWLLPPVVGPARVGAGGTPAVTARPATASKSQQNRAPQDGPSGGRCHQAEPGAAQPLRDLPSQDAGAAPIKTRLAGHQAPHSGAVRGQHVPGLALGMAPGQITIRSLAYRVSSSATADVIAGQEGSLQQQAPSWSCAFCWRGARSLT